MSRIILGLQPVREAIRAHGDALERVLVERGESPQLQALARFARDQGIAVAIVPRAELDRASGGVRHQGVLAVASELSLVSLGELEIQDDSLFVALDGLQDPQNFGAAIRSGVAFGAGAILWPEHASAPLTPATFRASAGAIEHAKLCRVPSLVSALVDLHAKGAMTVGLDASAEESIQDLELQGPVVLVVGSEGKGLGKQVRRTCQKLAKLPMRGPIDSLNASVAVAIALYEVVRQRAAAMPAGS